MAQRKHRGKPWPRKLSNGVIRWYLPTRETEGKPVAIRTPDGQFVDGIDNEAAAWEAYEQSKDQRESRQRGEQGYLIFLLEDYLAYLEKKKAAPRTLLDFASYFQWFDVRWPELLIAELTVHHFESWFDEHPGWGSSYRYKIAGAFRSALNWAVGVQGGRRIPSSPLQGWRLQGTKSRGATTLIAEEDHRRLVEAVAEDMKDVLIVLWETGTRPVNLWRVEARNLDAGRSCLVFGEWNTNPDVPAHKTARRTGRPLVIPLTKVALEILHKLAQRRPQGPLFRMSRGSPWDSHNFGSRLLYYKKRLGIRNVVAYGYRHSLATALLEGDVPDAKVAAILGHTNPAMLYRHYGHLTGHVEDLTATLAQHRGQSASGSEGSGLQAQPGGVSSGEPPEESESPSE